MLPPAGGGAYFDVADRRIHKFECGFIVGDLPSDLRHFAQLVVDALDGVRRIDDLADSGGGMFKNGTNSFQALRQASTTAGLPLPASLAANASRACLAASTVAAVWVGFSPAAMPLRSFKDA